MTTTPADMLRPDTAAAIRAQADALRTAPTAEAATAADMLTATAQGLDAARAVLTAAADAMLSAHLEACRRGERAARLDASPAMLAAVRTVYPYATADADGYSLSGGPAPTPTEPPAPFVVVARLTERNGGARVLVTAGGASSVRAYDHGASDPWAAAVAEAFPGAEITRSTTDGRRIHGNLEHLYVVTYTAPTA